MKCPGCAAPSGDDAVECPACGLVFAKWRERREKEKLAALKALEAPVKPVPNLWVGRLIAGIIVAAWLSALAVFYLLSLKRR